MVGSRRGCADSGSYRVKRRREGSGKRIVTWVKFGDGGTCNSMNLARQGNARLQVPCEMLSSCDGRWRAAGCFG